MQAPHLDTQGQLLLHSHILRSCRKCRSKGNLQCSRHKTQEMLQLVSYAQTSACGQVCLSVPGRDTNFRAARYRLIEYDLYRCRLQTTIVVEQSNGFVVGSLGLQSSRFRRVSLWPCDERSEKHAREGPDGILQVMLADFATRQAASGPEIRRN